MIKKKAEFTEEDNIRLSQSIQKKKLFLKEVKPSAQLFDYLLSQIDGSAVARRLRQKIDPRLGTHYAILPEGLEPDDIENWAWGETGLRHPTDPHTVLDDVVTIFLTEPSRRVLGQNANMARTELAPEDFENLVVFGSEFYWELSGPAADSLSVTSLPTGTRPIVVCFFWSAAAKRTTFDAEAIDKITERLVGLAVGALDEDTYLLWWRSDREPFPGSAIAPTR